MPQNKRVVTVDGHRITLTSPDKVLYPATGTTKADVLAYYTAIVDVLIPHIAHRPATRKRWVNGVGTVNEPGEAFFQKNLDKSTPLWVKRHPIQHKTHINEYPLVNDLATLTWFAQIAALDGTRTSEQVSGVAHELARALQFDHPDLIVSKMKKSLRVGKVFIDWSQNQVSKTTVTPYSLRGRLRPIVASPRTWEELASRDLAQLEYEQALQRFAKQPDPLAVLLSGQ